MQDRTESAYFTKKRFPVFDIFGAQVAALNPHRIPHRIHELILESATPGSSSSLERSAPLCAANYSTAMGYKRASGGKCVGGQAPTGEGGGGGSGQRIHLVQEGRPQDVGHQLDVQQQVPQGCPQLLGLLPRITPRHPLRPLRPPPLPVSPPCPTPTPPAFVSAVLRRPHAFAS